MANAVLDLCAFIVREGWEQREDEGDYPRSLAQKALAEADSMRAEIARLKAEVEDLIKMVFADGERAGIEPGDLSPSEVLTAMVDALAAHKRALAAGPTRLRALRSDDYSPGYVAGLVEAAQEAAMKEKP